MPIEKKSRFRRDSLISILLVEDNMALREAIKMELEEAGYHVLAAPNGKDGLTICESEELALILSDIDMPIMEGVTLLKAVKNSKKQLPVILMSGNLNMNKERAVELGAADFFSKPVDVSRLLAQFETLTSHGRFQKAE